MDVPEETMDAAGVQQQHDRGRKQQLYIGSKKTLNKTSRQTEELEIIKQIVGFSTGLRRTNVRLLWRSRPAPKLKRRPQTA
jgi:hypothetical protein